MKTARFLSFCVGIIFLLTFVSAFAARGGRAADAKNGPLPFDPSEESVYEGEISKALFRGINIANLRFTANRVNVAADAAESANPSASTLRFTAEVETKGLFPKLFSGLRFHQRIESTVDPSAFTVLKTVKLDEQGNRKRASEAVFDIKQGRVTWTERNPDDLQAQPRVVTSEFKGAVQDLASMFYFIRTQRLETNRNFEITVSDSGQVYRIPVRVGEKKRMKTVLGEVEAIRVEPELFGEGRLLRGKGQISIWFTTDSRHVAVRAQIKHEMGTLDIKLKSFTHNAKN